MYADDLVSLSPSAMILSLLLSVCSAYGIVHDIKYNSAKINVMIFCCNKIKYIHIPNFVLNNVLLTRVTKYKYLGHCISDDHSDDDDMARQYRQIYAQRNALLRKFFMCTVCVKMTLFRSFCTSLYACELWWQYMSESLRKLCVSYNHVFRFVCSETRNCSASHVFVSRGLNTCKMLIRKSIYTCMTSTKRSCNTILQNIVGCDHLHVPITPALEAYAICTCILVCLGFFYRISV